MIINDIDLPLPVFHAMIANVYSAGDADYTASSIVYGAKEYWGKKLFKDSKQRASGLWAAFTGTLMHLGLEKLLQDYNNMYSENSKFLEGYTLPNGYYILEDRKTISFNENAKFFQLPEDRKIGGAVDCRFYYSDTGKAKLYDYKTMSSTSLILEDKIKEFTEKANLYRWLMECTGSKIQAIEYIPIFKDWTLTKALRSGRIQEYPCMKLNLEMRDRKTIEEWMYNKIMEKEKYRGVDFQDIPICSPEERWEDPVVYKVCKFQADGSLGNQLPGCGFTIEEEAIAKLQEKQSKAKKGEEFGIKKTGGVPTKCMNWCSFGVQGLCKYKE